jgi:DNA-binding NtrC family response regulator
MEAVMFEQAPTLIGDSYALRSVTDRIPRIAGARRTTLITGPTGSGKEVVAAQLHDTAFPTGAPHVPVHCGALPEHLVESELFGHTRGAFTGATAAREGLVRAADGGTLFLDEVDSLSLPMQAKLLRFLESGEYRAVGSDRRERASVWVLAATNTDLGRRVSERQFREDLYFRLDVMRLELPALCSRGGDIELLARYFLDRASDRADELEHAPCFSEAALAAMRSYPWPGNVRELKHKVERAALLRRGSTIDVVDLGLPSDSREPSSRSSVADPGSDLWSLIASDGLTLAEALAVCEQRLIDAALVAEDNNRTRAAARLGIHVRTIFKKLSR